MQMHASTGAARALTARQIALHDVSTVQLREERKGLELRFSCGANLSDCFSEFTGEQRKAPVVFEVFHTLTALHKAIIFNTHPD